VHIHELSGWPSFDVEPRRAGGATRSSAPSAGSPAWANGGTRLPAPAGGGTTNSDFGCFESQRNRRRDARRGTGPIPRRQLTKCSHDTALRDIQDLVAQGVLALNPGADGAPVIFWNSRINNLRSSDLGGSVPKKFGFSTFSPFLHPFNPRSHPLNT